MSVKEMVLEKVGELPDDASPQTIRERIELILGVREAIVSVDAGKGIPKEDVNFH